MGEPKHTPGTWESSHDGISVNRAGDQYPVAIVYPCRHRTESGYEYNEGEEDVRIANARLIAAAPELLDACKSMVGWMRMLHEFMEDEEMDADVDALKAAIAKAEGR